MLSPEIQAQATVKSCAVFEDAIVAMLFDRILAKCDEMAEGQCDKYKGELPFNPLICGCLSFLPTSSPSFISVFPPKTDTQYNFYTSRVFHETCTNGKTYTTTYGYSHPVSTTPALVPSPALAHSDAPTATRETDGC